MLYYEKKCRGKGFTTVIGVDEAGRGPLAGPVVAGAVLLKTYRFINRIDDSKKLTPLEREKAYLEITAKSVFGIGIVNEKIIDRINIHEASRIAMEEAVMQVLRKIKSRPQKRIHILIDGNIKLQIGIPFTNIIRGDARSKSIACGSILAKVTRDRIMVLYDKIYPEYAFKQHKGYPTRLHRSRIRQFGPSLIQRMSFCCD